MAVHLSVAPPDGYEAWSGDEWERWLADHPWEPAESLGDSGGWLVFLYQVRVHAPKASAELEPWIERLITQRPVPAGQIASLRRALAAAGAELARVPASRLWTGTQFYTPEELLRLIVEAEGRTGRPGSELSVADLWTGLLALLDRTLARAQEQKRGVYFGHV